MSVTITFTAENAADAAHELLAFVNALPSPVMAPIVTASSAPASVETPKERTTRNRTPRADQTLAPQVEASTPVAKDPAPNEEAPEQIVAFTETDAVSLEDLRAKAAIVAQSGKQAGVKALLTKYEARSVSAVPEDQRSAFMADLDSLEMAEAS